MNVEVLVCCRCGKVFWLARYLNGCTVSKSCTFKAFIILNINYFSINFLHLFETGSSVA